VIANDALAAAGKDPPKSPGGGQHFLALVNRKGQRFLTIDILPGAHGIDADLGMPVIRSRAHDRINIIPLKQLAIISVSFAILVAVNIVHPGFGIGGFAGIDITDSHHLHPGIIKKIAKIRRTHPANAYGPNRDS
jgi:hypothetical protein